jgi:hypothetical protein
MEVGQTNAYLTAEQLAKMLQVKPSWIYEQTRTRCADPIPCQPIGRYKRFYPPDHPEMVAWLARQRDKERAKREEKYQAMLVPSRKKKVSKQKDGGESQQRKERIA